MVQYEIASFSISTIIGLMLFFIVPYAIMLYVYKHYKVIATIPDATKEDKEWEYGFKWASRVYPYLYVLFLLMFFLWR